MRKIFLLLLLTIFLLTGCTNGFKSPAKLIIGLDDEYAPMGFRDEQGELVGVDIDLAKETARRMGVAIEFKPINWDDKIVELKTGKIDLIWNGLDITPERQEHILYSKPYMNNRQLLLVKKGNDWGIRSKGDLAGKIVGTQAGSNSETYIIQDEKLRNSFAQFKVYKTFKTAFEDLDSGKVDVLICDEIAARYEMSKVPGKFELIMVTIGPATGIGIGFRKDDQKLRDRVQAAFDEVIADGTAKKISVKWFNADLINEYR